MSWCASFFQVVMFLFRWFFLCFHGVISFLTMNIIFHSLNVIFLYLFDCAKGEKGVLCLWFRNQNLHKIHVIDPSGYHYQAWDFIELEEFIWCLQPLLNKVYWWRFYNSLILLWFEQVDNIDLDNLCVKISFQTNWIDLNECQVISTN